MNKGGGEFWIIIAIVIYFTLVGWLASALGYGVADWLHTGTWAIPYMHYSLGILSYVYDTLIFLVNIILWFFQSLSSYFGMFYFTIKGDIPAFVPAIGITPVVLGFGWMTLRLVRG